MHATIHLTTEVRYLGKRQGWVALPRKGEIEYVIIDSIDYREPGGRVLRLEWKDSMWGKEERDKGRKDNTLKVGKKIS